MIPKERFGPTGHVSTRVIFGAAALSRVTQEEADRTLEVLISRGINHIDTAASYGDAELRIGPWMARHRADFFLATKTGERTYEGAREELHRSLERLRADHVDLLQLHNLVDPEGWEIALGSGGALEAAVEAREQGLVRFIGVTGHGTRVPRMHRRSLERFEFASVLLPCNYMMMQDPEYAADFEKLAQLCGERNVAVQTIKSVARRRWEGEPSGRTTWYEPIEEPGALERAVHWVLSQPRLFLNSPGDLELLPRVLDAAAHPVGQPAEGEMERDASRLGMKPLFIRGYSARG
jgi:aryl-alcohol dehydrogenase-like predicted oxidoreductase